MKLGVITATLNSSAHLAHAMAGLPTEVEHVVVDGGSTDSTEQIARSRPGTAFVSLPGSSIYDAWNAGLAHCSADVVCFVNSDDEVCWPAVDAALGRFSAEPGLEVINGSFAYIDERGARGGSLPESRPPVPLTLETVLHGACAINARWFRRSLFDRRGPFLTRYKLAADREWLLRCVLAGPNQELAPGLTYLYRIHAGSHTLDAAQRNALTIAGEHMAFAARHLHDPDLPLEARVALRRFHAESSLAAVFAAWRQRNMGEALRSCLLGLRQQLGWPLHVPKVACARVRRRRVGR